MEKKIRQGICWVRPNDNKEDSEKNPFIVEKEVVYLTEEEITKSLLEVFED